MAITTTPSGGPQGEFSTYTPIYSQTLSAATASITFSNIPTTFTDLVLVMSAATTHTLATFPYMRFNGDSTTNYSGTELYGTGSAASSIRDTSRSRGWIAFDVSISNTVGDAISTVNVMNYSNVTTYKTWLARYGRAGSTLDYQGTAGFVGLWRSTAAITSLEFRNSRGDVDYNFASGSTFTLYGIKAAATQFIPTNAAGGDAVASDGTYAYHVFKSSGIFAPAKSLSCDVLVVAGGGSGGSGAGGGGGAGGLRLLTSQTVSAQTTVTVGAGGASSGASLGVSGSGGSTSFGSISVSGGGGGGNDGGNGATGGSGGGSGGGSTGIYTAGTGNSGSYSPVEGYAGGRNVSSSSPYAAGGGGGSGGAGSNAGSSVAAGAGGAGANSYNSITFTSWLTATNIGVNGYLAGGGGGGTYGDGGSGGAGGIGGGGNGGLTAASTGTYGTANTGSGGGGSRGGLGVGGSGLVIVRYAL